jgi:LPXTG-motif cell wall-anchored protein
MQIQMSKKTLLVILGVLVVGLGLIVFLVTQQQDLRQRADQPEPTQGTVPACLVEFARCEWDPLPNTTQYNVAVTDANTGDIIKVDVINHPTTSFTFPAEPGKQYQCEVQAINDCGEGEPGVAVGDACPIISPTPTDVTEETPTPTDEVETTGTPGPTEPDATPTDEPETTPTDRPGSTPTDAPGDSPTPTTPGRGGPEETPTTRPTTPGSVVNQSTSPTPSPITKLPETGIAENILQFTIVGAAIALLGTFVIVFLW